MKITKPNVSLYNDRTANIGFYNYYAIGLLKNKRMFNSDDLYYSRNRKKYVYK